MTFRIFPEDDEHAQRIIAATDDDIQICGAYRPQRLNDWRFFVSKMVADAVGLPQPNKVHVVSRQDAIRWCELISTLYFRSLDERRASAFTLSA